MKTLILFSFIGVILFFYIRQIRFGHSEPIQQIIYSITPSAPPSQKSQEVTCRLAGGTWTEFPTTCTDTCQYVRGKYPYDCGDALTYSCDCGRDKCWDGTRCIMN